MADTTAISAQKPTRPWWITAMLMCGGLSLLLLPTAPLATRFGLIDFRLALAGLALATLLSLIVTITGLWGLRPGSDPQRRRGLGIAALLALPTLIVSAFTVSSQGDAPPIHQVTTDPENPPRFIAAVARRGNESNPLEWRAEVVAIQREAYPDLAPIQTALSPDSAFQHSLSCSRELGWEVYAENAANGHIEAEDTTFWFGFKDDVAIRVLPVANGSVVDLRSISRVGRGDLGKNADRIRAFRDCLIKRAASQ